MNMNIGNANKDVAETIIEENRMMLILVALLVGVIIGFGIGYLLFNQYQWHF